MTGTTTATRRDSRNPPIVILGDFMRKMFAPFDNRHSCTSFNSLIFATQCYQQSTLDFSARNLTRVERVILNALRSFSQLLMTLRSDVQSLTIRFLPAENRTAVPGWLSVARSETHAILHRKHANNMHNALSGTIVKYLCRAALGTLLHKTIKNSQHNWISCLGVVNVGKMERR
jgi:hypothetical protein